MATGNPRKMIAALQVSLDGFTQGADHEKDWVDSWADALGLIPDVDTFVIGARMYPGYGMFWESIDSHPDRVAPYMDRVPSKSEIAYARLAARSPHFVVSRTLESVSWPKQARIVRDVAELAALKAQPGGNIYVAGGATLVASLLNAGLIDELRLIVHPVALGRGQSLFEGIDKRLSLQLVEAKPAESGRLLLTYRT
jgi:dihydrofolate reductase